MTLIFAADTTLLVITTSGRYLAYVDKIETIQRHKILSLLITASKLCREEIPNILESFSQRHNTCISCRGNLKLANLFSFL